MEYLFYYIPQVPNKKWVNANKAQNIPVIYFYFNLFNNLFKVDKEYSIYIYIKVARQIG